jgi:hypothetical protein
MAEKGLVLTGLIGLIRMGLLRLWYEDFLVIIRKTDAGLGLVVGVGGLGYGSRAAVIVAQEVIAKGK